MPVNPHGLRTRFPLLDAHRIATHLDAICSKDQSARNNLGSPILRISLGRVLPMPDWGFTVRNQPIEPFSELIVILIEPGMRGVLR